MFSQAADERRDREAPLAARMRPRTLDEFIGQDHLIGEGHILRRLMESDALPSIILWGPPGTGKTTLASIVAELTQAEFALVSAVSAGVADLRRIIGEAQDRRGKDADYHEAVVLYLRLPPQYEHFPAVANLIANHMRHHYAQASKVHEPFSELSAKIRPPYAQGIELYRAQRTALQSGRLLSAVPPAMRRILVALLDDIKPRQQ